MKQFSLTLLIRVLLVTLVLVSVGIFLNSVMKYNAMMAEIEKMEKQQASYEELCEELQELLNSEQDPDYIIRIAKEKLGLYFPDEEIFYNDRNG